MQQTLLCLFGHKLKNFGKNALKLKIHILYILIEIQHFIVCIVTTNKSSLLYFAMILEMLKD